MQSWVCEHVRQQVPNGTTEHYPGRKSWDGIKIRAAHYPPPQQQTQGAPTLSKFQPSLSGLQRFLPSCKPRIASWDIFQSPLRDYAPQTRLQGPACQCTKNAFTTMSLG